MADAVHKSDVWLRTMRDRLGPGFTVRWAEDHDEAGKLGIEVRCVLVACAFLEPEFCEEHPVIAADSASGDIRAILRDEAGKIGERDT